jgi:hypothetical protein
LFFPFFSFLSLSLAFPFLTYPFLSFLLSFLSTNGGYKTAAGIAICCTYQQLSHPSDWVAG